MTLKQAIAKIAPGYVLSDVQRDQIARNTDETAAEDLPGVIESLARSLADNAPEPFDWRLVPVEWLLDSLDLSRSTDRYVKGWQSMAQTIGTDRVFELGRIVERAQMNLLDAIFLETHGRLPAAEGRAYYERQRLEGRSWGAICAEIERHSKGL